MAIHIWGAINAFGIAVLAYQTEPHFAVVMIVPMILGGIALSD